MPKYAIEAHPKKREIVKHIVDGDISREAVAERYGISRSSILRYLRERLLPAAAKRSAELEQERGNTVLDRIEYLMTDMQKLLNACKEYLQDPDNPDKYYLGPRAHEILVTWYELDEEGKRIPQTKTPLDKLLSQLEEHGKIVVNSQYATEDPRRIILKTAEVMGKQLELIAKIQGMVKDVKISVSYSEHWVRLKNDILEATEGYPEVRARIVEMIEGNDDDA